MKQEPLYTGFDEFLIDVRSQGRHAFSLDEVKEKFELSDKAINQSLYRLKLKQRIVQIRKGFYAILSPEYSKQGMVPPALFIDDMMKVLNKDYYVGLISAAALYGAAHQQPMKYFIITAKPALRNIKKKKIRINFYVKKEWQEQDIRKTKTDAGYINVSSPELTALDLLYYLEDIGINRIYTILEELISEIKVSILIRVAKAYPQTTAIQRLGFLFEKLNESKLSTALKKVLKERNCSPIVLSLNHGKEGELNDTWKVVENIKLEGDL